MRAIQTALRRALPTLSAAIVVLAGLPSPATASDSIQEAADAFWGQEVSSTLISISLDIPSTDLKKKECTLRFDIYAEYEKPASSYNIYERMWGKSTPKNCDNDSLRLNYIRVEIADEGSALVSSMHQSSNGQSVTGSAINYTPTSQTVPMYTPPFDQHFAGSRITFDWELYLQFGDSLTPVRICAHSEALFPGPIEGGWAACRG